MIQSVRVEITGGFVYIVFDCECVMMGKGPVVEIEAFHSIAECDTQICFSGVVKLEQFSHEHSNRETLSNVFKQLIQEALHASQNFEYPQEEEVSIDILPN